MSIKTKVLSEFKIGRTLGEGAFSKVKFAQHRKSGQKVAIKIIKKADFDAEKKGEAEKYRNYTFPSDEPQPPIDPHVVAYRTLSKEVRILMRLDHPNIVHLHQVIDMDGEIYLIMDFANGGELIDYIASHKRLGEKEGRKFFRQLISAIDHCHRAGVVHRDLKLENILLTTDKNLLLSDFGLGRSITSDMQYLSTFCGTPLYAGPELVSGVIYNGPPADIWSMGVVLFIMIAGEPPFKCASIVELYDQIKTARFTCPESFSQPLRALLAKILARDPNLRISMEDLRIDEWVNMNEDAPPFRHLPPCPIETNHSSIRLEENLAAMVTVHEFNDGSRFYGFRKPESLAIKFDDFLTAGGGQVMEKSTLVQLPKARPQSMLESTSPTSKTDGANIGRRSSLAAVFGRMFVRGGSGIKEDEVANTFSPGPKPTSPPLSDSHAAATSTPNPAAAAPLIRARRHSVAVGGRMPSSIKPLSNGAAAFGKMPTSPKPVEVTTTSKHQRRTSISTDRHQPTPRSSDDIEGSYSPRKGSGSNVDRANPFSVNSPRTDSSSTDAANAEKYTRDITRPALSTLEQDSPEPVSTGGGQRERSFGMTQISEQDDEVDISSVQPTTFDTRRLSIQVNQERRVVDRRQIRTPELDEIRSIRFSFNLIAAPPEKSFPEDIIKQLDVLFNDASLLPALSYDKMGTYFYVGQFESPYGPVKFEVEVLRVWMLRICGIKIRRVSGEAVGYKIAYDTIIKALAW